MVIFHSYDSLPEGMCDPKKFHDHPRSPRSPYSLHRGQRPDRRAEDAGQQTLELPRWPEAESRQEEQQAHAGQDTTHLGWNVCNHWNILKHIETYWNILKHIETYWNILKHIETITAMVTPWAGTAVIYGPRDESHVVDASLSIPGPNAIWWPIVGFVGLVWPCFNPPGLASIQQTWNIFFQSATNCGSRLIPFHWYILAVGKHLLTTAAIGTFLGITRGFLCFFYLALVITAKWCKSWTKLYRNI